MVDPLLNSGVAVVAAVTPGNANAPAEQPQFYDPGALVSTDLASDVGTRFHTQLEEAHRKAQQEQPASRVSESLKDHDMARRPPGAPGAKESTRSFSSQVEADIWSFVNGHERTLAGWMDYFTSKTAFKFKEYEAAYKAMKEAHVFTLEAESFQELLRDMGVSQRKIDEKLKRDFRIYDRAETWKWEYSELGVPEVKPLDLEEIKRNWPEGIPSTDVTEAFYQELSRMPGFSYLSDAEGSTVNKAKFMQIAQHIFKSCALRDIDPRYVVALLGSESSFNDRAASGDQAFRVTQMLHSTWNGIVTNPDYKDNYTSGQGLLNAPLGEVIQACVDYVHLNKTGAIEPVTAASAWKPTEAQKYSLVTVGYMMGEDDAERSAERSVANGALYIPPYVDVNDNVPLHVKTVATRYRRAAEAWESALVKLSMPKQGSEVSATATDPVQDSLPGISRKVIRR